MAPYADFSLLKFPDKDEAMATIKGLDRGVAEAASAGEAVACP